MTLQPRRRSSANGFLVVLLFMAIAGARTCNRPATRTTSHRVSTPVQNPIQDVLRPNPSAEYRDGIAAAILIDTSGSMNREVPDADGRSRRKIEIAQRSAMNLVKEFDAYSRGHSGQPIYVGVYEFSERGANKPSTRTVIPLGPPDLAAAQSAISKMFPAGDTPIGDAMIQAKHDVDRTGLAKRHILVITDGENNRGYSPGDVTQVISSQADKDRASIYFVAFDVAASTFDSVKNSGGLVLAASNEHELKGTLDYLLTGKILVEQPLSR
jgi:Mg-chelatase subunit ChlD